MNTRHRILILAVLVALLLALPATAFARKRIWKGRLTTGAELHEVIGSRAAGSVAVTTNPDGTLHFLMQVRGLSGPVSGVTLNGPATPAENAPTLITLCGAPPPSAAGNCTVVDGILTLEGDITSNLMAQTGVTGATIFNALNNDLAYVNVVTALNPAGEARGQLIRQ